MADACHCVACRKTSGHVFVSVDVPKASVHVDGRENVRWYASSEKVRRGFCGTCGSTLFFEPVLHDWVGIALGAFDGSTGSTIGLHTFVSEKGDYYEIPPGVPQNAR